MKTKYQIYVGSAIGAALFLLVGAFAMGLTGLINSSVAQARNLNAEGDLQRTITVVGEGQVSSAPDIALVNIGVQVFDPDVNMATQKAADDMEALMSALKAEGVAENDIQTSYYNVYVDRPYGPQGPSSEVQYQVSNNVQVTIRDLEKVTTILGVAIEAGANNINSVEFRLSDAAELRAQARSKAVDDALATAEELADLNSVAVGQVVSVSEVVSSGAYFVSDQSYEAAQGFGGGGAGPITPGEVKVNVQLEITYAILQ